MPWAGTQPEGPEAHNFRDLPLTEKKKNVHQVNTPMEMKPWDTSKDVTNPAHAVTQLVKPIIRRGPRAPSYKPINKNNLFCVTNGVVESNFVICSLPLQKINHPSVYSCAREVTSFIVNMPFALNSCVFLLILHVSQFKNLKSLKPD